MPGPFELSISAFAERAKVHADVAVRQVVLELATRIINRSPVDTGRFRGNWRVSNHYAVNGTLDRLDKTGEATLAEISQALEAGKFSRRWVISNNMPYGPALERGHSKQRPIGFVGVTVMEFAGIVDGVSGGLNSLGSLGIER